MTPQTITHTLQAIVTNEPRTIRAAVACEALAAENPITFFTDLLSHGCASGMVTNLIYYADTHTFFDTHYEEIETLRDNLETETGERLEIRGDLKNFCAWFAFEETARQIESELGL